MDGPELMDISKKSLIALSIGITLSIIGYTIAETAQYSRGIFVYSISGMANAIQTNYTLIVGLLLAVGSAVSYYINKD